MGLAGIVIERTRQREALARSAERLRATFHQAGVGIASSHENGHFAQANGEARKERASKQPE